MEQGAEIATEIAVIRTAGISNRLGLDLKSLAIWASKVVLG